MFFVGKKHVRKRYNMCAKARAITHNILLPSMATAPLENAHPAPVGTASFFRQKRDYYLAMPITRLFNTYIFLACILHTSSEIRCRRAQAWTHISKAAHVRR